MSGERDENGGLIYFDRLMYVEEYIRILRTGLESGCVTANYRHGIIYANLDIG